MEIPRNLLQIASKQGQHAHSTSFCSVCFFLPVLFKYSALLEKRYRHRGLFVSVKRYCFLTAKMCVHCGKDFSALGRLVFFSTECSLDNSFV